MPGNTSFSSWGSTGGGTTQTSSELLSPTVSKEVRQQGVLESNWYPDSNLELPVLRGMTLDKLLNFAELSFIMKK